MLTWTPGPMSPAMTSLLVMTALPGLVDPDPVPAGEVHLLHLGEKKLCGRGDVVFWLCGVWIR